MNLLFCIGCNEYDSLNPLAGAEADARRIFDILTAPGGIYDADNSRLLLSPTSLEMHEILKSMFPLPSSYLGFTFFFAGHGAVNSGGFYLCGRDTIKDRLSTTAFSMSHLFSVIADFQPTEVNIIVDACEAGGSSVDLGRLVRPDITGSSTSSSIAFLGACGADQYAIEENGAGLLTTKLIGCLTGETEVQTNAVFLDLVEIGRIVSPLVHASNPEQRPMSWGLSLFGGSRFAKNPLYGGDTEYFPLPRVSAVSDVGRRVHAHSSDLWELYRSMPVDFAPRQLLNALDQIFPDQQADTQELLSVLDGLSSTLTARADQHPDSITPSACFSTCLVFLLRFIDNPAVQTYLRARLWQLLDRNLQVQESLLSDVKSDEKHLISPLGVAGDLFYLPWRITRILGWLGSNILIERLLTGRNRHSSVSQELISALLTRYSSSLVAVTEAQAAPLHIFLSACSVKGWRGFATEVLNSLYESYCQRNGNVTRFGTEPTQVISYILSLTHNDYIPSNWKEANPCNLLPVLLLWGKEINISDAWSLRYLDRRSMNFFLPSDHRDFGAEVIENGRNHSLQIGFGIWTVDEFYGKYREAFDSFAKSGAFNIPLEGVALSLLSSLLFPDRVAFILEESIQQERKP